MIASKKGYQELLKAGSLIENNFFQRKGVRVALAKTDMTKETTDAIVNAANERLAHGGGLAGMIRQIGGEEVVKESAEVIKKQGKVETGTCAVTGPGKLPCGQIIHAVGPVWGNYEESVARGLLKKCVESVYVKANQLELESISISAISSGIFGYPKDLCAQDMLEQIIKEIDKSTGSLSYIRICIFDQPTFDEFSKEFNKYT